MANTFKFGNGNWAVKDGYALAYNDENNNFKPLPFDFTRASSATRVNKQGLIETVPSGKPRIDFTDNTSGHLLLEPSRTNVFPNSDGNLSTYASQNGDVSNASTSIDGFDNSIQINLDSGESLAYKRSFTPTIGVTYTLSFFVQMDDNSEPSQSIDVNSGDFSLWINNSLATDVSKLNTVRLGSSNIYRVSGTHTATSTNNRFGIKKYSTQSSKGFRFAGAQLEVGSYATSYIPTEGSSVTRVAETANDAGNSTVFNDSEGVLFFETATLANDSTFRNICISDSSTSDKIQFYYYGNNNNIAYVIVSASSTQASDNTKTLSNALEFNKIAIKYKQNDFAVWVNGTEVSIDSSGNTPTGLKEFAFDDGNGGSPFYGKVKDLKVYNTALTDTELQNLTS